MNRECSVEVCDRTARSKGLCPQHYIRSRTGGSLTTPIQEQKRRKTCSKCSRDHRAKGLCERHYLQHRRRETLKKLVDMLGGKCHKCKKEYPLEVYDFHHIDRSKKSFVMSAGVSFKLDKAKKEAKKCKLCCANCHRIIEAKYREIKMCK